MTVRGGCGIIYFIMKNVTGKIILTLLIIGLMLPLAACGAADEAAPGDASDNVIAVTLFPAYDFARHIAGDRASVRLIVSPGTEAHSYEPTPQDMRLLSSCMLIIANGGEGEAWLDSIADSLDGNAEILRMLDCVTAYEEELREGMQSGGILSRAEGGHAHAHGGAEEHQHAHEDTHESDLEYDEHVWTSPVNAERICRAICERLCALDPDGAEVYTANFEAYSAELTRLDAEFRRVCDGAARHTVIFADRFPVRYFVEEYGLEYYAAFPGCADDAEPSAKTVAFLIDKVRAEDVPAVFYIEFSNQKMADIISEETGCKTVLFHSCHNVTADELASGVGYLELMENNLASLKEALY